MPITRRRALMAGSAGVLAALLPLVAAPRPAAAQDASPLRTLTRAYNASGQQLFKDLAAASGNLVFSPYSIGTAMAMALAGARGETERQMIEVLQHRLSRTADRPGERAGRWPRSTRYDQSGVTPTCPPGLKLVDRTVRASRGPRPRAAAFRRGATGTPASRRRSCRRRRKLSVADALMLPGRGDLISAEYRALLKRDYAAEVFEGASLDDINAWVARQTRGKIERILDQLDPDAVAVLLNAVYFKARWAVGLQQVADPGRALPSRCRTQVAGAHHAAARRLCAGGARGLPRAAAALRGRGARHGDRAAGRGRRRCARSAPGLASRNSPSCSRRCAPRRRGRSIWRCRASSSSPRSSLRRCSSVPA